MDLRDIIAQIGQQQPNPVAPQITPPDMAPAAPQQAPGMTLEQKIAAFNAINPQHTNLPMPHGGMMFHGGGAPMPPSNTMPPTAAPMPPQGLAVPSGVVPSPSGVVPPVASVGASPAPAGSAHGQPWPTSSFRHWGIFQPIVDKLVAKHNAKFGAQ